MILSNLHITVSEFPSSSKINFAMGCAEYVYVFILQITFINTNRIVQQGMH
jgi:hypothetical protein